MREMVIRFNNMCAELAHHPSWDQFVHGHEMQEASENLIQRISINVEMTRDPKREAICSPLGLRKLKRLDEKYAHLVKPRVPETDPYLRLYAVNPSSFYMATYIAPILLIGGVVTVVASNTLCAMDAITNENNSSVTINGAVAGVAGLGVKFLHDCIYGNIMDTINREDVRVNKEVNQYLKQVRVYNEQIRIRAKKINAIYLQEIMGQRNTSPRGKGLQGLKVDGHQEDHSSQIMEERQKEESSAVPAEELVENTFSATLEKSAPKSRHHGNNSSKLGQKFANNNPVSSREKSPAEIAEESSTSQKTKPPSSPYKEDFGGFLRKRNMARAGNLSHEENTEEEGEEYLLDLVTPNRPSIQQFCLGDASRRNVIRQFNEIYGLVVISKGGRHGTALTDPKYRQFILPMPSGSTIKVGTLLGMIKQAHKHVYPKSLV